MVPTTTPPGADTLVGFRLVRRIGSGTRSEVFLAKPAAGGPDSPPVALKVFRSETEPAGIGRQVQALRAGGPAALARLLDVATTPEGRVCLVLGHLPGLTLDRLLTVRGRVGAGEVVTVAATVTATLQALHEAGLSHPLVQPSSVRFDDRGRPVLLGLGALTELPTGVAGVATRRDAALGLTGFLRCLLAYLDPADAAAPVAEDLLAEFTSTVLARPFPASLAGLEAALFAWAPAGPVRGAVPGAAPGEAADRAAVPREAPVPLPRLVSVAASEPGAAGSTPSLPVSRLAPAAAGRLGRLRAVVGRRAAVGRRAVTSSLAVPVRTLGARIERARIERTERIGAGRYGAAPARRLPGRRPVLLGAGLVVMLSIGGLAALSAVPPESDARSGAAPGDVGTEVPGSTPGQTAATVPADPEDGQPSLLTGDDPAAAVLELLRRREACLAEVSVLCLDGVDQPGSVLMAADGYRIRQLQAEPVATPSATAAAAPVTADVREHTGNAALVVLSGGAGVNAQPASALVIKGEAGWRLRELFDY